MRNKTNGLGINFYTTLLNKNGLRVVVSSFKCLQQKVSIFAKKLMYDW